MATATIHRRGTGWLWPALLLVAVGGWFYPYLGLLVLVCMLAPLLVATARGRHWCGWACPRGALFDGVLARVSRRRLAPAWLRSRGFRIGVLIFLFAAMGVQMTLAYPNGEAMARVFVVLLVVTTLVGVALAVAFPERTWCTFCPMGTMASWISSAKHRLRVAESCRKCGRCAKACPMGLTPFRPDASHDDCIKCGRCIAACPVNALSLPASASAQRLQETRADSVVSSHREGTG